MGSPRRPGRLAATLAATLVATLAVPRPAAAQQPPPQAPAASAPKAAAPPLPASAPAAPAQAKPVAQPSPKAASSSMDPAPASSGNLVVGAGLELDVASLQARVRKLEAGAGESDDARAQALRDYGAAVDQLELAAEWKQRAAALARVQSDGGRLAEAVRKEAESWARPAPSTVDADTTLAEAEASLAEIEARLAVQRRGLAEVDAELAKLAERRLALPVELATASAAREDGLGELDLPPLPAGSIEATLAQRALALASRKAAADQAAALELEMATHEARRELLSARRDLWQRKSDAYAARASELQGWIAARRVAEAEKAEAEARADQVSLARVHPILGKLAEENARLAAERTGDEGLNARIDATSRSLAAVAEQLQKLDERAKGVRQKVAAAGLTDAIGLLLRKEKAELPDAGRARAEARARRAEIADAQLAALNLEDLRKALPSVESEVERILAGQDAALAPAERTRIESSARNVLRTRRGYLDALIRDTNAHFASLVDLDARQAELVRLLDEYEAFLGQHVLWIPSAGLPRWRDAADLQDAALWLADPRHLATAAARVAEGARAAPLRTALALLALVALVLYRPRLKRVLAAACAGQSLASVPAPAVALAATALLAAPGPLAMLLASWLATASPSLPDEFTTALAAALARFSLPVFVFDLARRATRGDGLLAVFFGWPRAALATLRGQLAFAETTALPLFFVATVLDAQPGEAWSESLGRLAFAAGVAASGLAIHRVVRPGTSVAGQVLRRTELVWLEPLAARASWFSAAAVGGVLVLAVGGYYYTAFELLRRLWWSGLVVVLFLAATASTLRWLDSRAPAAQDDEAPETGGRESAQTRNLLKAVFGLALAAALFSVWVDVIPALRFFETVELWKVSTVVEKTVGTGDAAHVESVPLVAPVTLANVLVALLGAVLAVVGARNLPGFLELAVLSRFRLDRGLRYAIATVTRYGVFVAGSVVALRNLGVDWASVQWMVAAVSVGLGFGLQEIFGNFVSGLIVLFERPVRVGDTVTIDGTTGTVSRIEIRATTIVDGDRKELIVPNKELITGKLVNWSLNDPVVRLVVPVGVSYGSDTAAVVRVLQEVAKQSPTVLEDPAPIVAMTRFGDSSLDFELRAFVANPDLIGPTRHQLMLDLERRLRAAGIEIPFPQRDVNLRSVEPAAAAALAAGRDSR